VGFPRQLSAREREVLDRLLAANFPDREAFAAQLNAIEVVTGCPDCPCPSIALRVDPSRAVAAPHDPQIAGHRRLPVEASAPGCDVILFHDKGWLAYLECVVHDLDNAPVSELPAPEQLDVYKLPITG
jgi:hypothetical protein